MKHLVSLMFLLVLANAPISAQIARFESTKLNGNRAIKITTQNNFTYVAVAVMINGEQAVGLTVGHRHGLDTCNGILAVTKNKVVFVSAKPDHNFEVLRSELQSLSVNPWKSFGKVIYEQITLKVKGKDFNFFPCTDTGTSYASDFPFILDWAAPMLRSFDEGWKQFDRTYEMYSPKDATISEQGQVYQVHERYDKFKDQTTFATSQMLVKTDALSIFVQAAFVSPGAKASKPSHVSFYVDADDSIRKRFKTDRSLIFLLDNERLKLGTMEWLDSTYIPGSRYTSGTIIDELGITLTWDTFVKIAKGNSVEFQVGAIEARLTPDHLSVFKKLIAKAEETQK